jgi:hypothetical protein
MSCKESKIYYDVMTKFASLLASPSFYSYTTAAKVRIEPGPDRQDIFIKLLSYQIED